MSLFLENKCSDADNKRKRWRNICRRMLREGLTYDVIICVNWSSTITSLLDYSTFFRLSLWFSYELQNGNFLLISQQAKSKHVLQNVNGITCFQNHTLFRSDDAESLQHEVNLKLSLPLYDWSERSDLALWRCFTESKGHCTTRLHWPSIALQHESPEAWL